MTMTESVLLAVDQRGIATLTLNRAECHNAIDADCANLLIANLETLAEDDAIRAIILTGNGISFSAGHDIEAMRKMLDAPADSLTHDAREIARLLLTLDTLDKPTIASIQGSAFGLGVGLIACCDFAIGAADALFGMSEVRQGAVAALIMPYVVRAIGVRAARRYMLSTDRFNAAKAKRLGLLHQDVPASQLRAATERFVQQLLLNSPQAMIESKRLINRLEHQRIDAQLMDQMIERSVQIRVSDEGQEGMRAFIEHRKPGWAP